MYSSLEIQIFLIYIILFDSHKKTASQYVLTSFYAEETVAHRDLVICPYLHLASS